MSVPQLVVPIAALCCLASSTEAVVAAAPRVTKTWAFEPTNSFGDTYTHMSTLALTNNDTWVAAACQCVWGDPRGVGSPSQ